MLYCRMIRLDGTAARRNPGRPGEVVGGIIKIWDWEHREASIPSRKRAGAPAQLSSRER
jgi:hypothetical protein